MIIHRNGARPSTQADPKYFTGRVRMEPVIGADFGGTLRSLSVTFEPGARTYWHTHPAGQTLIVTAGVGRVQKEGEAVQAIYPGDVIHFAPGEKHWHGAAPDSAMTHIGLQHEVNGSAADWLEQVTDADYLG